MLFPELLCFSPSKNLEIAWLQNQCHKFYTTYILHICPYNILLISDLKFAIYGSHAHFLFYRNKLKLIENNNSNLQLEELLFLVKDSIIKLEMSRI